MPFSKRLPFGVKTDTGIIYVAETLDHETQPVYDLILTVSDGKHSSSTPVRIFVDDVNDNPPYFDSKSYNVTIFEEIEKDKLPMVLFNVKALDIDKVI